MSKLSSIPFNQAVSAYNKVLSNNKMISPSTSLTPLDILRTGDIIEVASKKYSNSFPHIVNGILAPQLKKIEEGERKTRSAISSSGNLIELMQSINSSKNALDTIIAVRDKVIGAYQEVLKMPL